MENAGKIMLLFGLVFLGSSVAYASVKKKKHTASGGTWTKEEAEKHYNDVIKNSIVSDPKTNSDLVNKYIEKEKEKEPLKDEKGRTILLMSAQEIAQLLFEQMRINGAVSQWEIEKILENVHNERIFNEIVFHFDEKLYDITRLSQAEEGTPQAQELDLLQWLKYELPQAYFEQLKKRYPNVFKYA